MPALGTRFLLALRVSRALPRGDLIEGRHFARIRT
jgi:hypothetical protein